MYACMNGVDSLGSSAGNLEGNSQSKARQLFPDTQSEEGKPLMPMGLAAKPQIKISLGRKITMSCLHMQSYPSFHPHPHPLQESGEATISQPGNPFTMPWQQSSHSRSHSHIFMEVTQFGIPSSE